MPRFASVLLFGSVIGLLAFSLFGHRLLISAETDVPVPPFALPLWSEDKIFTPDDLKGKVSVVHFFASWCGVCASEHPRLLAFSKQADIPFLGIAWRDQPQALAEWKKTHESPYDHIALDLRGETGVKFGIRGIPQTLLVDKNAHIRYQYLGALSEEDITQTLLPLIQKLKDEP